MKKVLYNPGGSLTPDLEFKQERRFCSHLVENPSIEVGFLASD
jgi:hypothetical protein